ncbi:MAG: hypothetical protein JWN95_3918 [Frankiales bacterium]|nr:hypothetical protein [Frankiales bacterium]
MIRRPWARRHVADTPDPYRFVVVDEPTEPRDRDARDARDQPPVTSGRAEVDPADETAAEHPRMTRPVSFGTALAALVLAIAVAVSAGLVWQHRSRTITRTVVAEPIGAVTTDATGCPIDQTCSLSKSAPAPLVEAVEAAFPLNQELYANSTFESSTGNTYRTTWTIRTRGGVSVSTIGECVPGANGATNAQRTLTPTGYVRIVPGKAGCSLTVLASTERTTATLPTAQLDAIATNPRLQLVPGQ